MLLLNCIFLMKDYLMFSPPHDLFDCRQLYIDTSQFHRVADDLAAPSWISRDCATLFCIEYQIPTL